MGGDARIHKHQEDGLVVFTDGSKFPDCWPERGCWFDGPQELIGWREIRVKGEGLVLVPPDDPRLQDSP